MRRNSERSEGPNWWMICFFTIVGAGLLIAAYFVSSYWQGVLDNGGTALLLFALLVFSEPKLIRHLRQPSTLGEALNQFTDLITPRPQPVANTSDQIRDRVLRTVGKTGLHQDPPESCSTRFANLGGTIEVEWRIEWNEAGLRHLVTAFDRKIPRSLESFIGWDKKIIVHEERIYNILCYLLHELESHA